MINVVASYCLFDLFQAALMSKLRAMDSNYDELIFKSALKIAKYRDSM